VDGLPTGPGIIVFVVVSVHSDCLDNQPSRLLRRKLSRRIAALRTPRVRLSSENQRGTTISRMTRLSSSHFSPKEGDVPVAE